MSSRNASKEVIHHKKRKSLLDKVVDHVCIPVYKPINKQWEVTFKSLGWHRNIIEEFWTLFCRINKSRSGEITMFEFLNYFNLDRSDYVEKCFDYFDTTGGESVDFLEFMISVWNICTMRVETLTKFTFVRYNQLRCMIQHKSLSFLIQFIFTSKFKNWIRIVNSRSVKLNVW